MTGPTGRDPSQAGITAVVDVRLLPSINLSHALEAGGLVRGLLRPVGWQVRRCKRRRRDPPAGGLHGQRGATCRGCWSCFSLLASSYAALRFGHQRERMVATRGAGFVLAARMHKVPQRGQLALEAVCAWRQSCSQFIISRATEIQFKRIKIDDSTILTQGCKS
jgi:hypothetical protein